MRSINIQRYTDYYQVIVVDAYWAQVMNKVDRYCFSSARAMHASCQSAKERLKRKSFWLFLYSQLDGGECKWIDGYLPLLVYGNHKDKGVSSPASAWDPGKQAQPSSLSALEKISTDKHT